MLQNCGHGNSTIVLALLIHCVVILFLFHVVLEIEIMYVLTEGIVLRCHDDLARQPNTKTGKNQT